jgi:iron complex outermembrane receptor protein
VLQQPVTNTNLVAKGTLAVGEHQITAEFTAAKVESMKSFSANQISSSTSSTSPFFNLAYPASGAAYNGVFNQLVKTFPTLEANRGQPLALRWRCMPCGPREIETNADTQRMLLAAEGPLFAGWDYKAGISQATSDVTSLLGSGYFYGKPFAALINTGVLNPFAADGISQTAEAMNALAATSAKGVTLYGGKTTMQQTDLTVTGPLFKLPAGTVMAAVGLDMRTEKYKFNGSATDLAVQTTIFNAPFDNVNTLDTVKRDIKAEFAELLVPVMKGLELTLAARHDNYSGFGGTTNPKASLRFEASKNVMLRGSYSTGFRVPTFNQLYNGLTESTYAGKDLVDPKNCPSGKVDSTNPNCAAITPVIYTGGKPNLGPEESKQWTAGFVVDAGNGASVSVDWWSIRKSGTIQSLSLSDMVNNYGLFADRFIRNEAGAVVILDDRWINAGETVTKGVDINARISGKLGEGRWSAMLDGSYLLDKRSRLISSAPMGASEIGVFTRAGDLGLRWKHSLIGSYSQGDWSFTGVQRYSTGYKDAQLPGVANGSIVPANWQPNVGHYEIYDASVRYTGIKNLGVTFGIKNLFDKEPPFSAAYDGNTGAGSSWEPRVADPRLRSFTFTLDYKFF